VGEISVSAMVAVAARTKLSWKKGDTDPKQCWVQVCVEIVKCSHFYFVSSFTHRCHILYAYSMPRFNF